MIALKYNIEDLKEMFLRGKLEKTMYSSTDEEGCDLIISIGENGFDISTNQKNGWIRIDSYDYDPNDKSWTVGETYKGKWK